MTAPTRDRVACALGILLVVVAGQTRITLGTIQFRAINFSTIPLHFDRAQLFRQLAVVYPTVGLDAVVEESEIRFTLNPSRPNGGVLDPAKAGQRK